MSFDFRIVAAASITAFALSFLTGVFTGAAFLILLLRALILAVVGGALAFGIHFAARKFLQETDSGESLYRGDVDSGKNVDIVLDGEEAAREVAAVVHAEGLDDYPGDEGAGKDDVEEDGYSAGRDGMESIIPASKADDGAERPSDTPEEILRGTEQPKSGGPVRPPKVIDDVDVLPDLDSLGASFVQPVNDTDPFSAADSGGSSRGSGSMSSGSDPETLAKAVRTILSKDTKG